jgi:hypothetical protein
MALSTKEKYWPGSIVADEDGRVILISKGAEMGPLASNEKYWAGSHATDEYGRLIAVGPGGTPVNEPGNGTVTLEKLATTALTAIERPYRQRFFSATTLGAAALSSKKYFILNGQTSQPEPSATVSQPWRIDWKPSQEEVEGLTTKCRLRASASVAATKVGVKVKIALFKVEYAVTGVIKLSEEVPASAFELEPGATTNGEVSGETADFVLSEGVYAAGAIPSGTTEGACGIQCRLLVHNTE